MRLIKNQTTNARVITGKGIKYDPLTQITSFDGNVMLIPRGNTAERPVPGVEGYIRYNTDLMNFEFFQDGEWRLNGYDQPTYMTNEVFYSGFDKQDILFGPLTDILDDGDNELDPNNTLVFVDQRFYTPNIDYTFVDNPDETDIGTEVPAHRIKKGVEYRIISPGATDFTRVGAPDSLLHTTFIADYTTTANTISSIANPTPGITGHNFAYAVDISNRITIVGSPLEPSATMEAGAGAVYLYNDTGAQIQKVSNPRPIGDAQDDHFGSSVTINTGWYAVGAWRDDDTLATGNKSGRVYLYVISVATGVPAYTLTNPDISIGDAEDWFGYSVALSETHLVVGAPKAEGGGKAYIYDLNDNPDTPRWVLKNPEPGADFGDTVAINDTYVLVGTHTQDKVYVFEVATGDYLYALENPNNDNTDMFGLSIDMSNDFAIVGAPGFDTPTGTNSGQIYIYDIKGHRPDISLYTIVNPNAYVPEDNDYFGYRVAVSDNFFMASAHQEDDAGGIVDTGRVYIFDTADGELVNNIVNPNIDGTGDNDRYGSALAADSTMAVVGAYEETAGSGAVYLHEITGKGDGVGLVREVGKYLKFNEPLNIAAVTKIRNSDGTTRIDFDFDVNNLRITLIYLNQRTVTGII